MECGCGASLGETDVQFCSRGLGGNTRVVRCLESDTIHEAMGHVHGDIYMTSGGQVMDTHGSLHRNGIKSNDTLYIHCRLRGGPVHIWSS